VDSDRHASKLAEWGFLDAVQARMLTISSFVSFSTTGFMSLGDRF